MCLLIELNQSQQELFEFSDHEKFDGGIEIIEFRTESSSTGAFFSD